MAGALVKEKTVKVLPGKAGQPYVPTIPAKPPTSTITTGSAQKCIKVG